MKISALDELEHYVGNAKITAPKFEINPGQIILVPHLVNYNIITSIIVLPFIVLLIQKTEDAAAIVPIALLILLLYSLWFDYNAVNKVEIDFDNDQILVKYRSPFRLLLSFMKGHRQKTFSIAGLNGFFCKATTQKISFRRFRIYAERKDQPDVLLIDFSSEEHAARVTDYLNKAIREMAKKAVR
jgi:hypothetical protein